MESRKKILWGVNLDSLFQFSVDCYPDTVSDRRETPMNKPLFALALAFLFSGSSHFLNWGITSRTGALSL